MKIIIFILYIVLKGGRNTCEWKMVTDTLGGDGIMVIDTLGNVLETWSAWDVWNVANDPYIDEYRYDRFHMNGLCFDEDGNYLLSNPIEDQIWKIDRQSGELLWKFGRNGDFEMDTTAYFSFQHSPYITEYGDLMLLITVYITNVLEQNPLNWMKRT